MYEHKKKQMEPEEIANVVLEIIREESTIA